jgi:hypothetical protein
MSHSETGTNGKIKKKLSTRNKNSESLSLKSANEQALISSKRRQPQRNLLNQLKTDVSS